MSSSHISLGLPHSSSCLAANAETSIPLCFFFDHLVSRGEEILIVNLHFFFLCVIMQHGMLAVLMVSSASLASAGLVLLFMYSIQSSSISVVSMSSSVSHMKETSLSWSQSVFEMMPSSVSPSEF